MVWAALCLAAFTEACAHPVNLTPPPAASSAEVVALSGASVMLGAGDIASCSQQLGVATALLVDSVLRADSIAKVDDAVFSLGDNVYPSGTKEQFAQCFTPSWGDPKKRVIKKLRPRFSRSAGACGIRAAGSVTEARRLAKGLPVRPHRER